MNNNSWSKDAKTAERNPRIYIVDGKEQAITSNPQRIKKRKLPKYLKLFIAVLGMYLVALFVIGSYQLWQLKKQIYQLDLEQKSLLTQQQELKDEMESLNSPEMIERIARESLQMVKPGETVIIPAAANNQDAQ